MKIIMITLLSVMWWCNAQAQVEAHYKCNVVVNQTGVVVWSGSVDNAHTFSISEVQGSNKVQQIDRYNETALASLKNTKVLVNFDREPSGGKIEVTDELSGVTVWAKDHISVTQKKSKYLLSCMTFDYKEKKNSLGISEL